MAPELDAIIVGGGLAGLTCARRLHAQGFRCRIIEASDRVGGRVTTDQLDGFRLDRGFQVFLTAYPEAQRELDYAKLELRPFEPGALIRFAGKFHRFSDPWRRPQHMLATAFSPVATLADKLRVAGFRSSTTRPSLSDIYNHPEKTTLELLQDKGFSNVIIERFFRPFLGGVFLDNQLRTSSRMCEFVFRMFSLGNATLPNNGMEQIPQQLMSELPSDVIQLNRPVASIESGGVVTESGERIESRAVVIATEAPIASKLLGKTASTEGSSVDCLYFATDKAPVDEPILVLNGDGDGPINNLCVPSLVSADYAPAGKSLVSVTVLGNHAEPQSIDAVRLQLMSWFGPQVDAWEHLRTYHIKYALPSQAPPALQSVEKPAVVGDGIFVCGDHCDTASINGAMASGRRAAEAVREFCQAN